jgi:hypothetical protein
LRPRFPIPDSRFPIPDSRFPIPDQTDDSALTLPQFLARRARGASDRRLAIDAGAGIVLGVSAVIFRPPLWILIVCAALCFAAFGAWGILDRELADASDGRRRLLLRGARGAAVFAGVLAGLGFFLAAFGYALGTWIS